MRQAQLVEKIARESGVRKARLKRVMKSLAGTVAEFLKNEGKASITGLGVFRVKEMRPRRGRNPKTGESIQVPAGKRICFKAGTKLKKAIS